MATYPILITLSLLVLLSYVFDMAARKTKIPSVLLLIFVGAVLQQAGRHFGFTIPYIEHILQLIGVVGLILIVLEAALDLKLTREKQAVIKSALVVSGLVLIVTSISIALLFRLILDVPFYRCFLNAIPFSVVSSAIAIPCAAHFAPERKEFIIYESTFSDILGIMLFNFVLFSPKPGLSSILLSSANVGLTVLLSVLCCGALLIFLAQIRHHVKFFIVFAILILTYAAGKLLHLHSLLVILVFGLGLNNYGLIARGGLLHFLDSVHLNAEIRQLKRITSESAFLVRTIFFVLLGAAVQFKSILNWKVLALGLLITFLTFILRFCMLRLLAKENSDQEVYVVPRGLITILLFYSIPAPLVIEKLSPGVLFLTILLTNALLMAGLVATKEKQAPSGAVIPSSDIGCQTVP